MMRIVSSTTRMLNRNTGFLILLAIVFFGFSIIGFQKDNRQLLYNTKQSVDKSNTIIKNLQSAVVELKADNQVKANTIICMLQVPISQRTPDIKAKCRAQAESMLPVGLQ